MSASASMDKAEPNLTPLLDVVFQLITFFMLVINFSNDNYDQRIKLPVAGSARPLDDAEKISEDRVVLNINKQGHLIFNGKEHLQNAAMEEIKRQAQLVRLNLRAAGLKADPSGALPTTIIVRADRETPFSSLYGIITACQASGFQKFALKAMNAE